MKSTAKSRKGSAGRIVGRIFISIGLILVLLIAMIYSLAYAVANGPSSTMRDTLVNMAMQASATKWIPGLVLSSDKVDAILASAKASNEEIIDIGGKTEGVQRVRTDSEGQHIEPVTTEKQQENTPEP